MSKPTSGGYGKPLYDDTRNEIMDFHFWFWIIIAFLAGRIIPRSVYIGHDEEKYKKADFGIKLLD